MYNYFVNNSISVLSNTADRLLTGYKLIVYDFIFTELPVHQCWFPLHRLTIYELYTARH